MKLSATVLLLLASIPSVVAFIPGTTTNSQNGGVAFVDSMRRQQCDSLSSLQMVATADINMSGAEATMKARKTREVKRRTFASSFEQLLATVLPLNLRARSLSNSLFLPLTTFSCPS